MSRLLSHEGVLINQTNIIGYYFRWWKSEIHTEQLKYMCLRLITRKTCNEFLKYCCFNATLTYNVIIVYSYHIAL